GAEDTVVRSLRRLLGSSRPCGAKHTRAQRENGEEAHAIRSHRILSSLAPPSDAHQIPADAGSGTSAPPCERTRSSPDVARWPRYAHASTWEFSACPQYGFRTAIRWRTARM